MKQNQQNHTQTQKPNNQQKTQNWKQSCVKSDIFIASPGAVSWSPSRALQNHVRPVSSANQDTFFFQFHIKHLS